MVKNPPAIAGDTGSVPDQEDPLEKDTVESLGNPSLAGPWGCKRVGHNLVTKQQLQLALYFYTW